MDSEQGATSLLESVKAHVNERLKSPFGGAFVIAWVAINWDKLFVLVFSEKSAELRAKNFAAQMTNADGLWLPVIYAALGLISYYLLSGIAIALFEAYGVFKRYVEQVFDSYRWVPPDQYIEWKKSSIKAIKDMQEIASDKLDKITALEAELSRHTLKNNELSKIIEELDSLEKEARAELATAKSEAAKAQKTAEDARTLAVIEEKKKNKHAAEELLQLAQNLNLKVLMLRSFHAHKDVPKETSRAIQDVFEAAAELIDEISNRFGK